MTAGRDDTTLPRRPGAEPPPVAPRRPGAARRALRWLVWTLVLLPVLAAVLGYAAWRSFHTEAGTRWWLARVEGLVPGLVLQGPTGALLGAGSRFTLESLSLDTGGAGGAPGTRVRLAGLRLDGLQLGDFAPAPPFLRATARAVEVQQIDVTPGPPQPDAAPAQAPSSLRLPVALRVDTLRIGRLAVDGLPAPVEDLRAQIETGDTHRLEGLALRWNGVRLDGRAEVGADAPMPLSAQIKLAGDPAAAESGVLPPWARELAVSLNASGPLSRFDLQADVSLQGQSVRAKGQVTPFDALPLAQLDARFEALDLQALLGAFTPTAPLTRLTGNVLLQLQSDAPMAVRVQLTNAEPGAWDRQRLPLRALDVVARGEGARWSLERADAQLAGDPRTAAGKLSASGQLDGRNGETALRLEGLVLNALDGRAPPMRLSGPITLRHEAAPGSSEAFGELRFDAQLQGSLLGALRDGAPQPLREGAVTLKAKGRATPTLVAIEALDARAGKARLDASGQAERDGADWDARAKLQLRELDPALWLPGAADAAWRNAGNALNGSASLSARVPGAAADRRAFLSALRGELQARLDEGSRLGGQPLALQLDARAEAGRITADGRAQAADNQASLALIAAVRGAPDERLNVTLDAPALTQLAGFAKTVGLGDLAGSLKADLGAEGPLGAWLLGAPEASAPRPRGSAAPAGGVDPRADARSSASLRTRGSVAVRELQSGTTRVPSADARWNLTLPGGATSAALASSEIEATLQASQIELPGLVLPTVDLKADGTLASHRATLRALLAQQPATPQAPVPAPLTLETTLEGAWAAQGDGGLWRGRLPSLALQPAAGAATPPRLVGGRPANAPPTGTAPAALPLVIARDVQATYQHGPGTQRLELAPGSADVLGAELRWSAMRYAQAAGAAPQVEAEAEVQPFVVAQLLQRLQPDFGWDGDLRVGAKLSLRTDPAVRLNLEVARTGGDLQVKELGDVQSLGLSEARVALSAQDGVWRFDERIVGSNLGRVQGRQSVRTSPTALWPEPDAPIEGELTAQVDNLATWGMWVPAGWRLGGELDATLRLDGRFATPGLTGTVRGRDLVMRNAIEGIAFTEGTLQWSLAGQTTRLESLRFKAGDGVLEASGNGSLGATPSAELRLRAERALLLGRVDRRVVVSGAGTVRLEAARISVDGRFGVDEGLIDISRSDAPSLGDDVVVKRTTNGSTNQAEDDEAALPSGQTPRDIALNLVINLGEKLRLRGRGIDTRLQGELALTAPRGKLAVNGEIRTDRGTYDAYGQQLTIERGVITFIGDMSNPRLDIQAVRPNLEQRVGVVVGGSALSPRVRLFSDPEMQDTEKLALLVTGRAYDSLGGSDTLLLQRAAMALLAGEGSSEPTFAQRLRLDELSVRQSDGATRETIVTLGKQISDRVYVGYERGLNAAAGNFQLIYRIAQRFTLRAQGGDDAAVDLIWIFRWN